MNPNVSHVPSCQCVACKPAHVTANPHTDKWLIDGCVIVTATDWYAARDEGRRLLGAGREPRTVESLPCPPR